MAKCKTGPNCLSGYDINCTSCVFEFELDSGLCTSNQSVFVNFNESKSLYSRIFKWF